MSSLLPSTHRLGLGLPGYLIPFAPLAFAPQRQCRPSNPPSPQVFLLISTHFTATPRIPVAPSHSSRAVSVDRSELTPEFSQLTCKGRLRALYAQ